MTSKTTLARRDDPATSRIAAERRDPSIKHKVLDHLREHPSSPSDLGWTYPEVAAATGISLDNAHKRVGDLLGEGTAAQVVSGEGRLVTRYCGSSGPHQVITALPEDDPRFGTPTRRGARHTVPVSALVVPPHAGSRQ
jgi:hypothetical protein